MTDWEADWRRFVDTSLPGRVRHPGRYLDVEAALASLDWLEAQGIGVLGIDGFHLDDEFIRPSMMHIVDWSSLWAEPDAVAASLRETRVMLGRWEGEVDFVDLNLNRPAARDIEQRWARGP